MTANLTPVHLNDPSVTTFIQALCIELNFHDACKRAGVGETKGKSYFRQPDITATIDIIRAELKTSTGLKGDMLAKSLEDMVDIDPIHIFDDYGRVKPLKDIPAHIRRTFKKFKVKYEYMDDENGQQVQKPTVYDIEFHDKTKAIEMLGSDVDRFKKKHEHKHEHELGQNASAVLLGNTTSRADERMKQLAARDVSPKRGETDES
jgi:hypothetical protein